jgi:hypothetical protein
MKTNWGSTVGAITGIVLAGALTVRAGLLAYEPFTNASGTAIIGSGSGFGFTGSWQANSSGGTATNTGYGLGYTDGGGRTLIGSGGAGFFQGLTTANTSMQPIRPFNFNRGTNGTDGTTTWISFLIARQGPTGTLAGNLYGRGANVPHDLGAIQKLAIGNSSGAASNTVGLIPTGAAGNLKGATNAFGGVTNFVVVRIDHVGAANDNAYLFVNPALNVEPAVSSAGASSLNGFDFSFNQLRVFAGGQSSAAQPYAEIIVDEYRLGESYADVAPFTISNPPPAVAFEITNAFLVTEGIALSGHGGSNQGSYLVLASTQLTVPLTNWTPIATNTFDANGNFTATNATAGVAQKYFRLMIGNFTVPPPGVPPAIATAPTNQSVIVGGGATFLVAASGTGPLRYQWFFNTNTVLANATNTALPMFNVQSNQAGVYSVVVANAFGAATSAVALLTVNPAPLLLPGAFFVSPLGSDANSGTELSPFLTISKGLNAVPNGGVVYLRGGTYAQSAKLSLTRTTASPTNTIRLWAYPGETPVINATGNSSDCFSVSGRNYHLKGLTVTLAGHNGINISGHSNLIENCVTYSNGNTGLHITGGSSGSTFPSYNLILNCDSYLNYDPPIGGNADGFSAKWNLGAGNEFRGCRAWWNSDDGWDLWMGTAAVVIDQSWAFYNGTNYWNDPQFNGNGQGFKLGGNYIGAPHRLLRSIAFRNKSGGIDQNNNNEGQTIDNNTSWANYGRNYNLNHGTNGTPHIVRNNLSFAGGSSDTFRSGSLLTNNSWQVITSPAVSASDVLSVDTSTATAPRNADGSLPNWPFLRPVPAGRLIDQGVILTEPHTGAAPDLGAFEDGL